MQHLHQSDESFQRDLDLGPSQEGREWVWPSGRRTPVIAGSSDMGAAPAAPAPAAVAEGGAPAAADSGAPAAPAQAAQVGSPDLQSLVNQFRTEAETRRKELGTVKERYKAFDGLHDDDIGAIGGLAQALRTDPQQAVQWMLENARTLAGDGYRDLLIQQLGAGAQQEAPKFDPTDPEAFKSLVAEQVKAALEGHTQQQTQQQEAQRILDALRAEGVEQGSMEWREVLHHMSTNKSSPEDAVKAVRGGIDAAAQEYARKAAERAAKHGAPPPAAPAAQPGGDGGQQGGKTMKDAKQAMQARLDAQGVPRGRQR